MLAALALEANRPMSTDRLIGRLWDDEPPASARANVHAYAARLRLALQSAGEPASLRVEYGPAGYLLRTPDWQVDVAHFKGFVAHASGMAGDDPDRTEFLAQALDLWTGEAMGGIEGRWVDAARDALAHERRRAVVDLVAAQLNRSQNAEAVARLENELAMSPLSEWLAAHLIRALHHSGREADALAFYASYRERIADELGVEPSAELRRLHLGLLKSGESTPRPPTAPRGSTAAAAARRPIPRRPIAGHRLHWSRGRRSGVRIGPHTSQPCGGCHGRRRRGPCRRRQFTLAIHCGHRLAAQYDDGQLYVNLRGTVASGLTPMAPLEALGRLLRALGVAAHRVPNNEDEAAALFRSTLAQARMRLKSLCQRRP